MADETLEQKINAPQQEEKKPVSTLESVINETFDAIKSGLNMGIAVAAPAAGYALTGNAGVLASSAAYVAATKGKKDSRVIRNESLSGALFGTFAHYTLLPLNYIGSAIHKVAYMIPWVFGANAFYMAEDHLIKERSPKGLYKKFKENYLNIIKKAFMLPAPLNILSALFLPQQYLVAAGAVTGYLFRRFVAGGKGEEQTDKTPYLVAAANVTAKLARNTVGGFYTGLYDVGKSINNALGGPYQPSAPAQPAPARPASAPAQAPAPVHQ